MLSDPFLVSINAITTINRAIASENSRSVHSGDGRRTPVVAIACMIHSGILFTSMVIFGYNRFGVGTAKNGSTLIIYLQLQL